MLINLVNYGTTFAQKSSAECLHLLGVVHESLRQKICREGGVESLVLFLEKSREYRGPRDCTEGHL